MIALSWIVPAVLVGALIFGWSYLTGQSASNPTDCYAPFLNDPYLNMSMYIVYYWSFLVAMLILYRGIATTAKALELKGDAREKRNLAILMGQRCMTQVGVGLLLQGPIGQMAGIKERADEKKSRSEVELHQEHPSLYSECPGFSVCCPRCPRREWATDHIGARFRLHHNGRRNPQLHFLLRFTAHFRRH